MTVEKTSPMGVVLRSLCGEGGHAGDGPIEVLTRCKDFNVIEVQRPDGTTMPAPADSLVAFSAQAFRELQDEAGEYADVWEFRVSAPTAQGAPPASARMFVAGADLFSVRALSKVVG